MTQAKSLGTRVLLLTSLSLRERAWWPQELDGVFFMPDKSGEWNRDHTLKAVSHLARTEAIDRVVPLDDFDLETAAMLREHLRLPGLGDSQTRFFRDKLAMRTQAQRHGLTIPDFVPILHHPWVREYTAQIPGPWVLKPRLMAGAIGIKKVHTEAELWQRIEALGDEQSYYLLERFVPGDVYHVDSVVSGGEVLFAVASRYGAPPLSVSQGGGIFTTRIIERGSSLEQRLIEKNRRVMQAMGLERGVSHTEFIVGHADGEVYFLETSARVGGANIADLVEHATGLNPWREWAKLECLDGDYRLPELRTDYAGLLVSLARQEWPDLSPFDAPEVSWRMKKRHHVGLVVRSPRLARVEELLEFYTRLVLADYHAAMPAKERPTE